MIEKFQGKERLTKEQMVEKYKNLEQELKNYLIIIPKLRQKRVKLELNDSEDSNDYEEYNKIDKVINIILDRQKGNFDYSVVDETEEYDFLASITDSLESDLLKVKKVYSELKRENGSFAVNSENIHEIVHNPTPEKYKALIEYLKLSGRKFAFDDLENELINSDMDTIDIVEFFKGLVENC